MDSIQSIFKIGIGPSSSHTLGPMKAATMFLSLLERNVSLDQVVALRVELFGSLSLTGKGHLTDTAILLGLGGYEPESVPMSVTKTFFNDIIAQKKLPLGRSGICIPFDYESNIVFQKTFLPLHENAVTFVAMLSDGSSIQETYYSVGSGEVETEATIAHRGKSYTVPFPFSSAEELLNLCDDHSLSIADIVFANEAHIFSEEEVRGYFQNIWKIMLECLNDGLEATGLLPGPLKVPRRANALYKRLIARQSLHNDPFTIIDRVNMFALAVSEQNASGARIVTAPTNGSCGIIPAVLKYYDEIVAPLDNKTLVRFFTTAGAIGLLFRENASLSGAEVGCQGEVGVACAMAAAGLAELMGASPLQVSIAAEIGMEHNLGLTCDPVNGQVQVPCIERNAVNAVKAINSARLAMERLTTPRVSLDHVIKAMMATGKDMHSKYRETSQGGLAALTYHK